MTEPFWETKSLEDMNDSEWEAICDGCAKCCLHKFIDDEVDDTHPTDVIHEGEQVHYSSIACYLLDDQQCQCTEYARRTELVPDCVRLTKDNLKDIFFMPPSCSYRRLYEGRGLAFWHPLLNDGSKALMHKAQMSVRAKTVSENAIDMDDFEEYIVRWPLNDLG